MTARTPYNIRKIATRVTVEGADVKHVQHSQNNFRGGGGEGRVREGGGLRRLHRDMVKCSDSLIAIVIE